MNTPLIFEPLLKVRVWGGTALKSRPAGEIPADPVGESWELADHGADTTLVAEGPLAGRSLHELMVQDRDALCGRAVDPANPEVFPLLLKLIDPLQDLSVQVHPNDTYAGQQVAGELGKTEAWYVLEAEPGAKLYRGFVDGVSKEQFAAAVEAGTVADILNGFAVEPGDVVYMPAGMVHALGAGVRIAEIQQNSDTTYRVFDWNRVGLDGQPRELHIDHALAVSQFGEQGESRCAPEPVAQAGCVRERFVNCEKFQFERLSAFEGAPVELNTEGRSFHLLTVVEGSATVTAGGETVTRSRWDSVLVPAAAGSYQLEADGAVLLFYR